ncbi:class I SAM-dependent methyltransferase [Thalassotalea profundi]|uniref:SAM-dependent methyltransferase n=1 Tax=Thalassotalea profundi TaxID=2036687 RepID=A0ABQ3IKM3_9GAMM|nr:class I SAM-dependent methyltransferase [Thalassotalea profundi]GHE83676.1 SAM-dependent methyltransferase [Thalassotalea profundi]
MKPALAFRQPHYPSSWKDLPNGELVLDHIDQALAPWWSKFFGYHLLKIGALSGNIDTSLSSIKHQITLAEPKHKADISADIDDLPLLEHSVDVCLLSHALEFSLDPHHVIREANRVLIPNGYLVITGFNPFSLVALNKLMPYRREQSPWNERFFSAMRVKDWLHLMGYEILDDQKFLHSTLTGNISQGIIARNWRKFASRYLPNLGSVYVIVAKKRVLPLTPIKPKWKLRTKLETINVSTMNSSSRNSMGKTNKH